MPDRFGRGCWMALLVCGCLALPLTRNRQPGARAVPPSVSLDPGAWGHDHVGKPVPEYMTGDECLFCHRKHVGQTWSKNGHQLTIRPASEDSIEMRLFRLFRPNSPGKPAELLMGDGNFVRYLRRGAGYGRLDLHSSVCKLPKGTQRGVFSAEKSPEWSEKEFGNSCAGCHSTGVDSATRSFTAMAIDCYACHGEVTLQHTKDTSLVHLSRTKKNSAREIASICGQCHLRHGKSRSTDLPYPNNFVAGDNLFRDYSVSFDKRTLAGMDTADRHIAHNIRDIVLLGKNALTCVSCHQVHGDGSDKHQELPAGKICLQCHLDPKDWARRKPVRRFSRRCQY